MSSFQSASVYPSVARTATPTPVIVALDEEVDAVEVLINATALAATPSVTFAIQEQDDAGNWVSILTSAALTTAAPTAVRLLVGKNVTAAANLAAQAILPKVIRIVPTHGNGDSITYSVTLRGR